MRKSWIRFKFHLVYHSLMWLRLRMSPFMHCDKCKRRRWCEEVIVNCGWCDRCFNESLDDYFT